MGVAPKSNIDVVGIEDVIDLLKEVDNIATRSVTKAARAGAKIALEYAKRHCPVSKTGKPFGKYPHPPGNLKKSLRLKLEKKRTKGKRVYQVGPNEKGWYAHFVDYGFTDRAGKYHEGNQFLRDSVDKNREQINRKTLEVLGDELKKVR